MSKVRISILAVLASVALVAACSKGGKAGGGGGKVTGAASSAVSVLPKDTQFVFGIQFDKVKQTKLWDKFGKPALEKASAELGEVKTECGIDVANDVVSAIFAGPDLQGAENKVIIIIKGKWDEQKANDCLTKMAAKKGDKKVTVKKEGKITAYAEEGGETMYAHWIDKNTVMMTAKPDDKAALEAIVEGKDKVDANEAFMSVLKKADTTATVWGAAVLPPSATAQAEMALGGKPTAMFATINLTKALDAKIGLRFDSDKVAKEAADKVNKELESAKDNPMFGEYAKAVKVSGQGKDAVIAIAFNEKQLDDLMAMIEQQLAPLLMMGLGGGMGGL